MQPASSTMRLSMTFLPLMPTWGRFKIDWHGCPIVKGSIKLLFPKNQSIKVSAHPAAQQIAESESRIAALKVQKRELLEAINAGKTALHTVNEVLETLDNAEGWSTWDVMGGGLMADLAKYEELDDAQEQIEQLQVELRRFKTELSDVEITADLQVTVDSFLKFADFFFDGLFADWAVLDHINQAQSRVENTKGQIKRVLALLKRCAKMLMSKSLTKREAGAACS